MFENKNVRSFVKWGVMSLVIGALLGALIASFKPISYESSLSFSVNQINKQETQDYQFDGYYAIQASDLFSETIVSWFQTPSFLLEIYTRAGVDPQITSLDGFTSRFKMKKFSSQNLVLKFTEATEEKAEKLSKSIIDHVEERAGELNQNADSKALFQVVGGNPVIVKKELTVSMGMLYGLIAAGAVFLFVTSLFAAFRRMDADENK